MVLLAAAVPTAAQAQTDPRVSELRGELEQQEAKFRDVAAKANAALDAAQEAAFAQQRAAEVVRAATAKLTAARTVVAARRDEIKAYAAAAYRSGGSQAVRDMSLVFGSKSENALRKGDTINYVGRRQRETLQQAAIERRQEQLAAEAAEVARDASRQAADAAAVARRNADASVARQRDVVEGVSGQLVSAETAAKVEAERRARAERLAEAERIAQRLAEEERLAEAKRLADARRVAAARRAARRKAESERRARQRLAALATAEATRAAERAEAETEAEEQEEEEEEDLPTAPTSAGCVGGNLDGYQNGRLPRSALCPLWGAPSHRLRGDAAAAFRELSRAYAGEFGRPMCVTDSYRSYFEQVDVKRRKPGLAATPGTSQHGWGLAVDLCDGVQSDGTPTNRWLRNNAGRFRFFHPRWANAGGSGPYEPWHWEFAG